jgi:predicted Zn-dependent peptidase
LFPAGSRFQNKPLTATSCARQLTEGGSHRHSAPVLAELTDYCGGTLQSVCDKDYATVSLLTLRKHLESMLEALSGVLANPLFPARELNIHLMQEKQQWKIDSVKPRYVARVEMSSLLFGKSHPYGYVVQASDFSALRCRDLRSFYQTHYSNPLALLVSGQVTSQDLDLMEKHLGCLPFRNQMPLEPLKLSERSAAQNQRSHLQVSGALQSALRVAAPICPADHPDAIPLMVMNTLLGGYFGSRLMKRLREEKGYTYGVYSMMVQMVHAHVLIITTEVGTGVTREALDALYSEIDQLRSCAPPDAELYRVKQYLQGEMLRSFDGPFLRQERLRSLLELQLPLDHFDRMPELIQQVTPTQVRGMAAKYLAPEGLFEVVAGDLSHQNIK